VGLSGYTKATFTAPLQTAFQQTVATHGNVSITAVNITSITDTAAPMGRRSLFGTGDIIVNFAVLHPTAAAAQATSAALTAAMSGTTFGNTLNAQLLAAGGNATTVAVASTPVVTSPATSAAGRVAAAPLLAAASYAALAALAALV
jgi:hypothetical protein